MTCASNCAFAAFLAFFAARFSDLLDETLSVSPTPSSSGLALFFSLRTPSKSSLANTLGPEPFADASAVRRVRVAYPDIASRAPKCTHRASAIRKPPRRRASVVRKRDLISLCFLFEKCACFFLGKNVARPSPWGHSP
jgi:hypothetical protein